MYIYIKELAINNRYFMSELDENVINNTSIATIVTDEV